MRTVFRRIRLRAGVLLLIPCLIGAHPAAAPRATGRVTVWVYRSTPCRPVQGAVVRLGDAGLDQRTGADGVARFDAVPVGPQSVTVETSGRPSRTTVRVAEGADVHASLDLDT